VTRWQVLWLPLACAMSAGVNHAMRPVPPYALSESERTTSTGALSLEEGSRRHDFKLVSVYVVSADLPRVFADPLPLRELWLRSAEQDGQPPDLELFADFAADGTVSDVAARDIASLRGRPLPIVRALGADLHSRVRLPGAPGPARVEDGQMLITEAIEFERGKPAQGYRIRARLELKLADGDTPRTLKGELNARLVFR
jgi:hypothetical protein